MNILRLCGLPFVFLALLTSTLATTVNVPASQPTIQAGINAAHNGDVVLVAPGKYFENINFLGKAITVKSSAGAKLTIIDGNTNGSVVQFVSGETTASVLTGFTVRNGRAITTNIFGGGILIQNSSPSIIGNWITQNQAAAGGAGIAVFTGSPLIAQNQITNNRQNSHFSLGMGGGGILISGVSSSQIIGNTVSSNSFSPNGGGIAIGSATAVVVMNNLITGNTAVYGDGGGLWLYDSASITVIQNVIAHNTGRNGGGAFLFPLKTSEKISFVNNTITANTANTTGSAIQVFGVDDGVRLFNNLLVGLNGINAVWCDGDGGSLFSFNDAFQSASGDFGGTCSNQSGSNGNISVDPDFANGYRLKKGSPAINAGTNSAPNLPLKDLAGHRRIVGGIVDLGAYEY